MRVQVGLKREGTFRHHGHPPGRLLRVGELRLVGMDSTEPFQFFDLPKVQRARVLIALVLAFNAVITWVFFKEASGTVEPPGEVGLLCTAPSVAALLMLLKREGLDGAKLAQVMAWVFVVVGTMFSTFFMVFSVGASASERMSGSGMVAVLLAVQMAIPAGVRWARTDVSLVRAYFHYARIFAVLVPVIVLGMLFS